MKSRIIKFRAWDSKYNEMYYLKGDSLTAIWDKAEGTTLSQILESESGSRAMDEKNYELMQYTGLTDIAKVDCYESDIVKAVWSEDINDEIFGIGKVIFHCYD